MKVCPATPETVASAIVRPEIVTVRPEIASRLVTGMFDAVPVAVA